MLPLCLHKLLLCCVCCLRTLSSVQQPLVRLPSMVCHLLLLLPLLLASLALARHQVAHTADQLHAATDDDRLQKEHLAEAVAANSVLRRFGCMPCLPAAQLLVAVGQTCPCQCIGSGGVQCPGRCCGNPVKLGCVLLCFPAPNLQTSALWWD